MSRVRTLDSARYAETFAVLVSRSAEYAPMNAYLCQLGQARLLDGFSMLDVGAGTGTVIEEWLATGGPRPGGYLGIEPLPDHASDLRETLKRLELDGSVEEGKFSPAYPLSEVFDFALFSHSLYWLPEPVRCVENALAWLSPEGVLLAFLQAPMGIHSLFRLFDPLIERDAPVGSNHGYSSHELVVALREARPPAPLRVRRLGLRPHRCIRWRTRSRQESERNVVVRSPDRILRTRGSAALRCNRLHEGDLRGVGWPAALARADRHCAVGGKWLNAWFLGIERRLGVRGDIRSSRPAASMLARIRIRAQST